MTQNSVQFQNGYNSLTTITLSRLKEDAMSQPYNDTPPSNLSPFERIRQVDDDDQEFWSARDLMPILEYTKWQNFKTVLLKAQIACENSGNDPADHFTDASKMVAIGSDAKREVEDMLTFLQPLSLVNAFRCQSFV